MVQNKFNQSFQEIGGKCHLKTASDLFRWAVSPLIKWYLAHDARHKDLRGDDWESVVT